MFDYTFNAADGSTRTIAAPNLDTAEKIAKCDDFKPYAVVGCKRSEVTIADFNRQFDLK